MTLIQELRWRGMIQDIMPGTEELFEKEQVSGYIGFDPTSDSLHIGSLVPILLLVHLQRAGHKPVALVGGATGMVGDPSGKSEERNLLSEETLQFNLAGVQKQLAHFLNFDPSLSNAAEMVNNYDWFKNFNFLDFIRDVGKHITVNYMMAKDSVKKRIEGDTGMSFTEFTYQLIQGYDFYWLYQNKNCKLQMGGSDQWGNITSGIDLIRRMAGGQAHAVTYPLITKSDGTKFGKSAEGAVWLDPTKTSPYKFYQFWINCADDDVVRFLKIFTFLSPADITDLAGAQQSQPGARLAHRRLAQEVTALVHGESAVAAVERITAAIFSNRIDALTEQDFAQLAQDGLPSTHFDLSEVGLLATLFESGLATTPKGEVTLGQAKKLILGNSVSVNGVKLIDPEFKLQASAARYRHHCRK